VAAAGADAGRPANFACVADCFSLGQLWRHTLGCASTDQCDSVMLGAARYVEALTNPCPGLRPTVTSVLRDCPSPLSPGAMLDAVCRMAAALQAGASSPKRTLSDEPREGDAEAAALRAALDQASAGLAPADVPAKGWALQMCGAVASARRRENVEARNAIGITMSVAFGFHLSVHEADEVIVTELMRLHPGVLTVIVAFAMKNNDVILSCVRG
jgi:hypothetical protein